VDDALNHCSTQNPPTGPFGLAFSLCDGCRSELKLAILLYLLHLLTNLKMSGSGLFFLLSPLPRLVVLIVTINRAGERVKLMQLFDWIFRKGPPPMDDALTHCSTQDPPTQGALESKRDPCEGPPPVDDALTHCSTLERDSM
jgi:hypothetical protein